MESWRLYSFFVDKKANGIAKTKKKVFKGNSGWGDNEKLYLIEIEPTHYFEKIERKIIDGELKDILIDEFGNKYGCGFLIQQPFKSYNSNQVLSSFKNIRNNIKGFLNEVEEEYHIKKKKFENKTKK